MLDVSNCRFERINWVLHHDSPKTVIEESLLKLYIAIDVEIEVDAENFRSDQYVI